MAKFNADKLMDVRVELSEAIDKIVTVRELLNKGYSSFEITKSPLAACNVSESSRMMLNDIAGEIKALSFQIESFRDQAMDELELTEEQEIAQKIGAAL